MKRKEYRLIKRIKFMLSFGLTALIIYFAAAWLLPIISPLILKTAAFSAALSMPEAAIEQIAKRVKSDVAPSPAQEPQIDAPIEPEPIPEPPQEQPTVPIERIFPQKKLTEKQTVEVYEHQQALPQIPSEYIGEVITEDMSDTEGKQALKIDNFRLRNDTALPEREIRGILDKTFSLTLEDTTEPQVLIYHTHATESYCPYDNGSYDKRYNWRSTDNNINMVAVGAVMAQVLRENGIAVIHDTAQHDYPSYNGSYANSYRSIKDYMTHYPTIKVILDIHRDAIERSSGHIIKPAIEYNGESYAQLMIVSNCDDGSGLLPNWRENLRFAAAFCSELESRIPKITRPILFSYRKYNQQLSNSALLLEFGSHSNTLEEACRTAEIAGKALAKVLKQN